MKYIGNKSRVLEFIEKSLQQSGVDYHNKKVLDLFAGTGSVSSLFLSKGCHVTSCDNMTYSICEQYRTNYFLKEPNFEELSFELSDTSLDGVLKFLNNLKGLEGYFFNNYAPSGKYGRQYFSDENAIKIDAIREKLESWKERLSSEKFLFLLGVLMCAADRVSNTSGTYGAYLKIWRSMALKTMKLEKPKLVSKGENIIVQCDVIDCAKAVKKQDIIYLDPPYNSRQYASNFHVLESICVYDKASLRGKTGLRDYSFQKSNFCIKRKVYDELKELIQNCDAKTIVMSYSTEGLLSKEEILSVLKDKGKCDIYQKDYRRFKTNSRTRANTGLKELLFVCKIEK